MPSRGSSGGCRADTRCGRAAVEDGRALTGVGGRAGCDHRPVPVADAGKPVAATETALIVPVDAADPVVGRHRAVLDRSAAWGVPAHVTVLYPFVAPDRIGADIFEEVRAAVAGVPRFDCVFGRVEWFGQDVAWLAPEPDAPFRTLTRAVCGRFPDHAPYRGAHPDVVPHLTVGSTDAGGLRSLRQAAAEVQATLPVTARIDRVLLIAGTDAPGSWRTLAKFALSALVGQPPRG